MLKFKINPKKQSVKNHRNIHFAATLETCQWVKVMAAINEVSIPTVINQACEFAKNNSERITL